MSINEINLFKNEIYLKIRELEKKFVSELTKKNSEIDSNFNIFKDKINIIMENNRKLIESITNEQLNFEKIKDLEKAIKSLNENLTTNKVKVVNLTNDVDRMRFRYDKLISDNLIIPGYIGPGCSYRNIGEYIVNSIIDITKLKQEKEIIRREDKELKSKVELMLRNMNTMVEHNSIKIRDYINTKDHELGVILDEKFKKYDEQTEESNQKVINSQNILDEKIKQVGKDIGKELEKFNNYKKDLNSLIDNKFEENEKIHDEINNKIYLLSLDIKEVKKMKKELNDQIKNLNSKIDSIIKSKSTKQSGGVLTNENINSVKNTNNSNNSNNNTCNINETQSNVSKMKSIDAKTRNEFPNLNKKSKPLLPYNYINKTNNFPEKVLQKNNKENGNDIKNNPNSLSEKKIIMKENNFVQINKNLKVKDIERNQNKHFDFNEESTSVRLLKNMSKNATLNEQKISEKIIQKSLYNNKIDKKSFTKDKKISVSTDIKNFIKAMGTNLKKNRFKLANFEYTKILSDKGLSLSEDQNFVKIKRKDFKQSLNQNNIKAIDCNVVNLNSQDVPNIDLLNLYDTSNNNINFNNSDIIAIKRRKIKSVEQKKSSKDPIKLVKPLI